MADDVRVYKRDDSQAPVSDPAFLSHVPIKVEAVSDVPGDWSGSVADWVMLQGRLHASVVTLSDDQYESLFPGAVAQDETDTASQSVSHGTSLASALMAPPAAPLDSAVSAAAFEVSDQVDGAPAHFYAAVYPHGPIEFIMPAIA